MLLTGNDNYDPLDQEEMSAPLVLEMTTSMAWLDAGTRKVLANIVKELARARLPDAELQLFDATLAALKTADYTPFLKMAEDASEHLAGQIGGQVEAEVRNVKKKVAPKKTLKKVAPKKKVAAKKIPKKVAVKKKITTRSGRFKKT